MTQYSGIGAGDANGGRRKRNGPTHYRYTWTDGDGNPQETTVRAELPGNQPDVMRRIVGRTGGRNLRTEKIRKA